MQAIILAAGYGKRLKPLTDSVPKCLVPVRGKPLLVRTLELLDARGIDRAVLVVGHKKEMIYHAVGHRFGNMRISYVENDIYDRTNNVYSLWLARDRLCEDSLLIECDLYYSGRLLDALVEQRRACNVLVSKYDPALMNGTVISIGEGDTVRELVLKRHQTEGFDYADKYKTVNMYYFAGEFLREFFLPYLELFVRSHGSQSYYEQVLGTLVYIGEPRCHAVIVESDQWCEIDDENDLRRADGMTFDTDGARSAKGTA
jgi:NDP-sugar pyrophosphorylase family protein